MLNIRDKEINYLGKMISSGAESSEDFSDQWKVLLYDADCRDIISPLLNVGALRQKGITLHMLLNTEREAVPDAPAVYFIRPTEENIRRIVQDCSKQLYRNFNLHFVTRIERPLMEKLASDLVAINASQLVTRIYDQYLDVIALEPSLFTLNIKDSFIAYNDPSCNELQIRSYISRVSMGLLSMIRVLGAIPIIRASNGGAAEMLAQELNTSLRENISPRGPAHSLLSECLVSERPRPLLLVFDRTTDMAPPFLHSSTYQSLIDDLLEHHLNRVTVEITSSGSKDTNNANATPRKKTYDLNTQSDQFFSRFAGVPFPEAVEANEKELADVSQREKEIRSHPGATLTSSSSSSSSSSASAASNGSLSGGSVAGGGSELTPGSARDLSEAIESLPEILAKKANLEAHTNILQAVMKKIATRDVPTFFEIEQNILTTGRVDKSSVTTLLRDGTKGLINDKARLLLLVVINNEGKTDEFETAFVQGCATMPDPKPEKAEIDKVISTVTFVKRLQSLQTPLSQRLGAAGSGGGGALSSLLSSAQTRASSLMAKAASFFTKFASLYVTKVVDNLSEGRSCAEDESFCTLDPRVKQGDVVDCKGQKFPEVIVFVMGGGCYSEFFNLQDLLKLKTSSSGSSLRNIIYGSTELISGDKFLEQIQKLVVPI